MKRTNLAAMITAVLLLVGCEKTETAAPPAMLLTSQAVDHYCGMTVLEHPGPKGQIILQSRDEPVWFTSSRDAVAFTKLPEEPKDIAAIYVSDMSRASSWEHPGNDNWIDARGAHYVIDSSLRGGMGAAETVPFSSREAAAAFAVKNGGKIVGFEEIPESYVLGADTSAGAGHGDTNNEEGSAISG
ncbi:copper resistance protein CopZ [Rhizobium sp. SEMIA 4085]|uniref:Nitrous oxidase accessory protein NosL n=1 Tax=Rhizobium gallicum bv. gallicum R602sp TaxID=1041138 RepID=A0A0B4XGF2_9HYPH|nr:MULTISPECIES: nitrous oxide reductase accessory protein NosL [Rhizobium]AJD46156.1 nitrous oxidase accessory protein NosL [Rhizobium gallicum bv. gallicum R602sp]NNH30390.1 copper resistance protein CopZ [Rhizobium sp. SEMIA 4085]